MEPQSAEAEAHFASLLFTQYQLVTVRDLSLYPQVSQRVFIGIGKHFILKGHFIVSEFYFRSVIIFMKQDRNKVKALLILRQVGVYRKYFFFLNRLTLNIQLYLSICIKNLLKTNSERV